MQRAFAEQGVIRRFIVREILPQGAKRINRLLMAAERFMRRAEPVQHVGRERALREFAQQIAEKSDRLRRFVRRRVALPKRVIGLFQQAVQVIPPRQGVRPPCVCGG